MFLPVLQTHVLSCTRELSNEDVLCFCFAFQNQSGTKTSRPMPNNTPISPYSMFMTTGRRLAWPMCLPPYSLITNCGRMITLSIGTTRISKSSAHLPFVLEAMCHNPSVNPMVPCDHCYQVGNLVWAIAPPIQNQANTRPDHQTREHCCSTRPLPVKSVSNQIGMWLGNVPCILGRRLRQVGHTLSTGAN